MFSGAISAFGKVVREKLVKSVGGLVIRVALRPLGFCYLLEAYSYFPSQTIPHGRPTALSFGGSAQGGFAYSLLVPLQAGHAVMGVHFFQVRLGFVYAPLLHDRPIQIPNVSHDGLRQRVLDRFDLMIDGIRL